MIAIRTAHTIPSYPNDLLNVISRIFIEEVNAIKLFEIGVH